MKIKAKHTLRKPGGCYVPGVTSRVYPRLSGGGAEIVCAVFYPARDAGGCERKPYIDQRILPDAAGVTTNTIVDAPICRGRHPLLLFSHGYGLYSEANTVQMEALASQGYVVISVGHPGEGAYIHPNGTLMPLDLGLIEAFNAALPPVITANQAYSKWLWENRDNMDIDAHRAQFCRLAALAATVDERCAIWASDFADALDGFLQESDAAGSFFHGCIDAERIGAFGMSLGGSAALGFSLTDSRVKAVANMDGYYYHPRSKEPLTAPVLLMQSGSPLTGEHLIFPFLNAAGPSYHAVFTGSNHANFTDYSEILAEKTTRQVNEDGNDLEVEVLGPVCPDRMEDLMNLLLTSFFNKYLRGQGAPCLDGTQSVDGIVLRRRN